LHTDLSASGRSFLQESAAGITIYCCFAPDDPKRVFRQAESLKGVTPNKELGDVSSDQVIFLEAQAIDIIDI